MLVVHHSLNMNHQRLRGGAEMHQPAPSSTKQKNIYMFKATPAAFRGKSSLSTDGISEQTGWKSHTTYTEDAEPARLKVKQSVILHLVHISIYTIK